MSAFDVICILLSIPFFLKGLHNAVWIWKFNKVARITSSGIVVYKITERNVK